MEREGNEYFSLSFHILFSHFSPWGKWGKKYVEGEGNEYLSLSFHILFFHFSHGEKWENTHFSWVKMGLDPTNIFFFYK